MLRPCAVVLLLILVAAPQAAAQALDATVHFATSRWSEFDGSDNGIGGRVTFKPSSRIGLDADLTWYPSGFPSGSVPFSGSRIEGLFGATIGPRINRVRPFAKAAAGFVKVGETPIAFACVTIFPPPLACVLAGGATLQAYEIGGGIEVDASARTFLRAEISDRILKYPGPTFDSNYKIRDDGFFGGGLRFSLGAGVRF